MTAYLISLALAALVWLWFDRESRKPGWGRVHRPTVLAAMKRIAVVIRTEVMPAFARLGAQFAEVGRKLEAFGAIPVVTSDLVAEGKAYLIDLDALRLPPPSITFDHADDETRRATFGHELRFRDWLPEPDE